MDAAPSRSAPLHGQIMLRYWASARAAAGVECDFVEASGPVPLAELVETSVRMHPGSPTLLRVLECCSVLVEDRPVARADPRSVVVHPGESVEFLPPFAGG
jgi:hypothetical protein